MSWVCPECGQEAESGDKAEFDGCSEPECPSKDMPTVSLKLAVATLCNYACQQDLKFAPSWEEYRKTRNVGEAIALMHSELSEALEAYRKDLPDSHLPHRPGLEVELADVLLRVAGFCKNYGLDLPGAVVEKNQYNKTRADHSMEARNAPGGKKF